MAKSASVKYGFYANPRPIEHEGITITTNKWQQVDDGAIEPIVEFPEDVRDVELLPASYVDAWILAQNPASEVADPPAPEQQATPAEPEQETNHEG